MRRNLKPSVSASVFIFLQWLASTVLAGTISISAGDAGFVTAAGGSSKGDGTLVPAATYNYSVGYEVHYATGNLSTTLAPLDRNNYFAFDLTGVSERIIAASLILWTGTHESGAPETFELVAPGDPGAATADIGILEADNAIGVAAFDDPTDPAIAVAMALYGNIAAGTGITSLGSAVVSSAIDDSFLTIALTMEGLDYLNAFAGGPVILGGSVSTIDTALGTPQQPFGFTGPDIPGGDTTTPVLSLTFADPSSGVPIPATLLLVLAGILVFRRRAST